MKTAIISALSGIIVALLSVGFPFYASVISMEKSVADLTNNVKALQQEVTELQTSNNLLTYQVKELMHESPNR